MPGLKEKVVCGFIWRLLERIGAQGAGFLVSIVLARLLVPADFGAVAMLAVFISVSDALAGAGLGAALIQKKTITQTDACTVFYTNLFLSALIYAALFFAAPAIAAFLGDSNLAPLIRRLGLTVPLNAACCAQNALLSRGLLFKLSFKINLIQVAATGAAGIALACRGFGAWALVLGTLCGTAAGCAARWALIAWRPRLLFSFSALKALFGFGWKMLFSSVLDSLFSNLSGLLIGKVYSKADLAFYNRGRAVPQLTMDAVSQTLGAVAFPALARMQDDPARLRAAMRRMLQCSSYLLFPLMTGLALCAKPAMRLLFGEAWLPGVPFMTIACFGFALYPFHIINLQALAAMGRSDIFLKLEIIKKLIMLPVVFLALPHGALALACGLAFAVGPLAAAVNAWPNRALLNYSLAMQLRDVAPYLALSGAMAAAVWALFPFLPDPAWAQLLIAGCAGGAVYTGLSALFRVKALRMIVKNARQVLKRK